MLRLFIKFYLFIIRPIVSFFGFRKESSKFSAEEKTRAQGEFDNFKATIKTLDDFIDGLSFLRRQGFSWKSDPARGALDYSPIKLWLFFARKGDDCDGWSELAYQILRSADHSPKMWVIMDGWNVASAHVVCTAVYPPKGGYVMINNSSAQFFNTEDECLEVFRKKKIMDYGLYPDLKKILWKS